MEAGGMKGETREKREEEEEEEKSRRRDSPDWVLALASSLSRPFLRPSLLSPTYSFILPCPVVLSSWRFHPGLDSFGLWLRLYLPFPRILSRLRALRVLEILASPLSMRPL